MGILNKQDIPNKWKNKYFDLLDDNEKQEKSYADTENLLSKTIVRLCQASKGFNNELDPYLLGIRKQLKNGLKSQQLKSELEKFSSAIMTLDEPESDESKLVTPLLFDFLTHQFPEQKKHFQSIESEYHNNKSPDPQHLFIAINKVIKPVEDGQSIATPPESAIENNGNHIIDAETVKSQLQILVDETEIPAKFENQAIELKQKLDSNTPLSDILDETISLLSNIKKHIKSEQNEMTEFLTQLTDQLTELGNTASGTQSASVSTAKKRNLLDQSVSSQMLDLQNSSKNATELEPLKQLIHDRLAGITQQIQDHQVEEDVERDKANQQLLILSSKINRMEQESHHLKDKLVTAHQKAIRDPLTGLPNRLAYDERLAIELARRKRYKAPLSLLIWDIDNFKLINDTYGHKAGDKTLILIAKLLSQYCRETDFVSRFGGEEFTMLLSDTDDKSALIAANKLRMIVEKAAFHSNGKKISITISCGITQFTNDDSTESAFNRADQALYRAKDKGRNRCVIG